MFASAGPRSYADSFRSERAVLEAKLAPVTIGPHEVAEGVEILERVGLEEGLAADHERIAPTDLKRVCVVLDKGTPVHTISIASP